MERRQRVVLVALSRIFVALTLLIAGANQWWGQAAVLLAVGCLTNIADDRMANNLNVNKPGVRRLRGRANTLLAFCALCAAILGGIWHWQFLLLALFRAGFRWYEPHLHGDWLVTARTLPPFCGLCLLVLAEASFVHHALGLPYVIVLSVLVLVAAAVCYIEQDRIYAFMHLALRVQKGD